MESHYRKSHLHSAIYLIYFLCRLQQTNKMKVFAFALLLLAAVTYGEYCFLSCYVHISCVLMKV